MDAGGELIGLVLRLFAVYIRIRWIVDFPAGKAHGAEASTRTEHARNSETNDAKEAEPR